MRRGEEVAASPGAVTSALARTLQSAMPKKGRTAAWTWNLQIVAPDSKAPHDPRRETVRVLREAVFEALEHRLPDDTLHRHVVAAEATRLAQVWALEPDRAAVGVTPAGNALTRVPGGTLRLRRAPDAVSRSGLKLEEAVTWIGVGPDKGDRVADLGAAPGGWSQVALHRGARVIAVDPAAMRVSHPTRRFTHIADSAFRFVPAETLDWVLCDMAHRPLEVAKLLAKWAQRGWARQMIANIKLPMKRKAHILREVRAMLETSGWTGLRARQLFYDRDEVTLFAWLDPRLAIRGPRAPFRPRKTKTRIRPRARTKVRQRSVKRPPRT